MADVIEVPHMTVSIFASVNGGLVNSSDYEVEATPPALNLMPPGGLDMRLIFTCSARTLSVKQATS